MTKINIVKQHSIWAHGIDYGTIKWINVAQELNKQVDIQENV